MNCSYISVGIFVLHSCRMDANVAGRQILEENKSLQNYMFLCWNWITVQKLKCCHNSSNVHDSFFHFPFFFS